MKKLFSLFLLTAFLAVGNVWADSWVLTAPADLQSGDIVVIADQTSGKAMSNNNGTSKAPSAVTVTFNDDKSELTGTIAENVQWTVTINNDSYQFGVGDDFLYCTNTNNGVRVGSNANKAFTITQGGDNDADFLVNAATLRYIGVYNSQDWRCYTSINNNIKATVTAFYKLTAGGSEPTAVSVPTFSVAAGTYTSAKDVELSCETEDATIYYTLDGTDPTEAVSPLEYTGAIAISETTTIMAYAVKEDMADSQVATATYTIVTIEHAGTEEDPYTVADARNAIDANTGKTNVYATGIVSKIVTAYNSQYGNISYNISADGETTSDQLQAFRGKSYNGVDFASEDDIQVGDVVVIYGNLTKYNSTYEFEANNQLVSLNRPVDTTPSIEVASTSIEANAAETEGTIIVTYNNITEVAAEVQFCNAQGEAATYDWVEAEINASNNIDYVIAANTGAARTAYMKVYALDDGSNDVYSGLITISQAAYVAPVAPADFMYAKITATEQITDGQYLIVYEGNDSHDAVAFDGSLETLDAANNGVAVAINEGVIEGSDELAASEFTIDVTNGKLLSASGLYIGVTSQSNGLKQDEDVDKYTNSFEIDNEGNAIITAVFEGSTMTMKYNYASGNLRFRYYKSGQQDIALYKRCNLVLGTNGYSTYADDAAFTVSGATAYKAHYDAQQGAVVLTEVSGVIPAEQGIILKGEEGAPVTITPSAEEPTADFSDNNLVAVVEATIAPTNAHVLATIDDDNVTKFHPCAGIEIPAHKAYIVISGNNAPVRVIFAENNATAINNLEGDENAVKFIENGKLYIRKNGVVYDATGAVVR